MKRILAIICAILLSVFPLVGCGDKEKKESSYGITLRDDLFILSTDGEEDRILLTMNAFEGLEIKKDGDENGHLFLYKDEKSKAEEFLNAVFAKTDTLTPTDKQGSGLYACVYDAYGNPIPFWVQADGSVVWLKARYPKEQYFKTKKGVVNTDELTALCESWEQEHPYEIKREDGAYVTRYLGEVEKTLTMIDISVISMTGGLTDVAFPQINNRTGIQNVFDLLFGDGRTMRKIASAWTGAGMYYASVEVYLRDGYYGSIFVLPCGAVGVAEYGAEEYFISQAGVTDFAQIYQMTN